MARPRLGANTAPTTAAFGDAAAAGTAGDNAALASHRHGMPANPVVGHGHVLTFDVQMFSTAGTGQTWTKPTSGLQFVVVEVVGGGGSGGSAMATASNQSSGGGGGGGGGYSRKTFLPAQLPNATYVVDVGAGGAAPSGSAANNGNPGTQSRFVSATPVVGGGGIGGSVFTAGTTANSCAGGAGGTATGGDLNLPGGYGGGLNRIPTTNAVTTASSVGGVAGGGMGTGGESASGTGGMGWAYGGGGAGGRNAQSSSGVAGGLGRDGVVIVTSYILV